MFGSDAVGSCACGLRRNVLLVAVNVGASRQADGSAVRGG